MTIILISFILIILIIGLILVSTAAYWHRSDMYDDMDSQYIDENGDHIYYDRSLIEKKDYARRFPHSFKDVRRFSQLFKK